MSANTRHVRLGIVYRGSIIQEEMLDRRVDVSVGLRAGSTVQVSAKDFPDFPDHVELLLLDAGQYYLVVPADPSARVSLRGANSNETRTIRGKRCIPVEGVAGGSLVVGDVSIMFQFVRGDTTPTITRDRTVLRIGLVYADGSGDERLISDRIFPDVKEVSIGTTKASSIVLPEEDYQGPPILFLNNKDGSVTMKAPAGMKMMVAVDGSPMELKELQQKGKARQEGNEVVCHLQLGTRGRATMGAYKVLFQVVKQSVTVPAFAPKSMFKRVTGPFMNEPTWTISFLAAFLLIGSIIGQALLFQKTTGKYLGKAASEEEMARSIYEVEVEIKEEVKPPEPEAPEKETVDIVSEKAKEAKKDEDDKKKPDKKEAKVDKPAEAKPVSTGKQIDPEEARRNAREAVAKKSIAGALLGAGGSSTKLFGAAAEGEEGTVVAKTFGGSTAGSGEGDGPGQGGGVKLAGGSASGGTMEKVAGSGKAGFGTRKTDDTKVEAKKEETAVKVSLSSGDLGGSGEGKADVAKVIARKNSAVQRCYEMALRDNPDEGGKVKVAFTVGTAGTVTDVSVSGASGGFAECIKSKFMGIRGLPILPAPQSFNQSYVFSKN